MTEPKPMPPRSSTTELVFQAPPTERIEIGLTPETAAEVAESAITNVIFCSKGPRIPAGFIANMAFGKTQIDNESHQLFLAAVKADERIVFVGKSEYEIVGDTREIVINEKLIEAAMAYAISVLQRDAETERIRQVELRGILRKQGYFLISEELDLLFERLGANPCVKTTYNGRMFYKERRGSQRTRTARNLGSRGIQPGN
jgi:hypothetical protein